MKQVAGSAGKMTGMSGRDLVSSASFSLVTKENRTKSAVVLVVHVQPRLVPRRRGGRG